MEAIYLDFHSRTSVQLLKILLNRHWHHQPRLINTKDVRMIPSTVSGGMADVTLEGFRFDAGYLDGFKQRTSDTFVNIVEHALGAHTQAVTGHEKGYVLPVSVRYDDEALNAKRMTTIARIL